MESFFSLKKRRKKGWKNREEKGPGRKGGKEKIQEAGKEEREKRSENGKCKFGNWKEGKEDKEN